MFYPSCWKNVKNQTFLIKFSKKKSWQHIYPFKTFRQSKRFEKWVSAQGNPEWVLKKNNLLSKMTLNLFTQGAPFCCSRILSLIIKKKQFNIYFMKKARICIMTFWFRTFGVRLGHRLIFGAAPIFDDLKNIVFACSFKKDSFFS